MLYYSDQGSLERIKLDELRVDQAMQASPDTTEESMRATAADVARLAGVSVATVSRVLNGSNPVSLSRKERVVKAIAELRYTPNLAAADLSRMRRSQRDISREGGPGMATSARRSELQKHNRPLASIHVQRLRKENAELKRRVRELDRQVEKCLNVDSRGE